MKLRKFIRGKNFYFQMLEDDGSIVLQSQPYKSKDARNNGVDSVKENMRNPDRYDVTEEGGQSYFILKAANGQEISRSRGFDSQDALKNTMDYAQGSKKVEKKKAAPVIPQAEVTSESQDDGGEAYGTDGKTDDYKPLGFYESKGNRVKDGFDSFSAGGEHYFSYSIDSKIYLISEGYKANKSRDNGINSVKKNMVNGDRYQRQQHPNGQYFFNLKAGNNQEIATSRWFDGEGEMNEIIGRLSGEGGSRNAEVDTKRLASDTIADARPTTEPKKKRKNRRTTKKPKAEKVYLADGDYPHNNIKYQLFRSGNNKHYFTFKNPEGKTILLNSNVRGFDTQEQGQAKLDEVFKYGPKESNYEGKITKNGKYYFYLKDDDGNNIAKSFFFKTEADMQVAIGSLCGPKGASTSGKSSSSQEDSMGIGLAALSDDVASTDSKAAEEESVRKAEEEAAAAAKAEEEAAAVAKAEEEAARKAEEEAAAAAKAAEEESARKAEEEAAAAAKAAEEEAARKAEEEAAAKAAEEESARKAEEEAAAVAKAVEEEAARKAAEEAAAKAAEEESARKAEEEEAAAAKAVEEEAARKAEEAVAAAAKVEAVGAGTESVVDSIQKAVKDNGSDISSSTGQTDSPGILGGFKWWWIILLLLLLVLLFYLLR